MELQFTNVRVGPSVFLCSLVGRFEQLQFFSCDSQFVFVLKIHRITSTIPLGFDSRSVAKKLSTSMEKTACLTN